MGTFQVLYRGKIWYAYDTVEGYKLTRDGRAEIMSDDEFTYALKSGDVKMLEKKDKKMKKNKIIEIKEEVTIGDKILEVGDKVKVMKESKLSDNASEIEYFMGDVEAFIASVDDLVDVVNDLFSGEDKKFAEIMFSDYDKGVIKDVTTKLADIKVKID